VQPQGRHFVPIRQHAEHDPREDDPEYKPESVQDQAAAGSVIALTMFHWRADGRQDLARDLGTRVPLPAFPPDVRQAVYTTNTIEALHRQISKTIKGPQSTS
jgi:transposase-like protein